MKISCIEPLERFINVRPICSMSMIYETFSRNQLSGFPDDIHASYACVCVTACFRAPAGKLVCFPVNRPSRTPTQNFIELAYEAWHSYIIPIRSHVVPHMCMLKPSLPEKACLPIIAKKYFP